MGLRPFGLKWSGLPKFWLKYYGSVSIITINYFSDDNFSLLLIGKIYVSNINSRLAILHSSDEAICIHKCVDYG